MEKLFESYVATKLKRKLNSSKYSISIQDTGKHLFEEPKKKFALRPDIVITRKSDNAVFVMDTKWKKLYNNPNNNYGISQADMYQMFAYQKKYDSKNVTLIYPLVDEMMDSGDIVFKSDEESVYIKFVDLLNIDDSLRIIESIYSEV
jgi:5-methylcytosine-specific restriction enzyme subunit McrC